MARLTFTKEERLCHKNDIGFLFKEGHLLFVSGYTIRWIIPSKKEDSPVKILISVPKRFFKKAVERNRIKRLLREIFRQHKEEFYSLLNARGIQIHMALIYGKRKMPIYQQEEERIVTILQQLKQDIAAKQRVEQRDLHKNNS
ncbi:MAG: ribonuclease P protein component [Bacteroidetes bacterium]|nr:MAG: ribonuclease P protein component [Bacteroidota bacterium]